MAFRQIHSHDPDCPVRAFFARDLVFPAHWHEDVELAVALEGRVDFFLDGERVSLGPGDGALAAPRSIHAYDGGGGTAALFIFPAVAALPAGVAESAIPPMESAVLRSSPGGGAAPGGGSVSPAELARLGVESARGPAPGRALVLAGIAAALRGLFAAAGAGAGAGRTAGGEVRIRRALAYLEDHYARRVSIAEAAAAAGLSPWYFSRLFPRLTGARFVDWVAARRLAEAERLLADSDLSVTEIAEEAGFGGIRAMDRVFRARRGMSPRDFRRARV